MNMIIVLWGETIALFFAFSACRALKGMLTEGEGFGEAILNGIIGQAKWHIAPEHLVPVAWVVDIYLAIMVIATIIVHFVG